MANVAANMEELLQEITQLKKKRNAIILSHVYQRPEVQDMADFVGDSLELSRKAADTDADVVVFCGVHFMAESAAILSPQKTVLLPELKAGCPMADMVTAEALRARKAQLPDVQMVCYVNTTAEVKAECDIACTSANAVQVINSLPQDRPILFVPDRNLGGYVMSQTGREMILWEGHCYVHDQLTPEAVQAAKEKYPQALFLAHPECNAGVLKLADHIASTTGMLRYARDSQAKEYIIATEQGILHQFHVQCPDKKFYPVVPDMTCPDMKTITLEKVLQSLQTMQPRVSVPEDIRVRALNCLDRMLAVV